MKQILRPGGGCSTNIQIASPSFIPHMAPYEDAVDSLEEVSQIAAAYDLDGQYGPEERIWPDFRFNISQDDQKVGTGSYPATFTKKTP
jgi:hypothetical protein